MIQGADSGILSKQENTWGTTAQQTNHHEHRQKNKDNVIQSKDIRNKHNIKTWSVEPLTCIDNTPLDQLLLLTIYCLQTIGQKNSIKIKIYLGRSCLATKLKFLVAIDEMSVHQDKIYF